MTTRRSRNAVEPDELVELAHRRLNLSRARWKMECIVYPGDVFLRTTEVRSRRSSDARFSYRARAEAEPAFLAAVAASVAELSTDRDG